MPKAAVTAASVNDIPVLQRDFERPPTFDRLRTCFSEPIANPGYSP